MTPIRTSPLVAMRSNYQAAVAAIEEAQKLLDFGITLKLFLRPLARLRQIQIGIEEQAIGTLELPLHVFRNAVALQSDLVQSVQTNWVAIRLDVGRDVF